LRVLEDVRVDDGELALGDGRALRARGGDGRTLRGRSGRGGAAARGGLRVGAERGEDQEGGGGECVANGFHDSFLYCSLSFSQRAVGPERRCCSRAAHRGGPAPPVV